MRRLAPFAILAPLACGNGDVTLASNDGGDYDVFAPRGVGARCDDGGTCRAGLTCKDGTCQPSHAIDEGGKCVISAECKDGLYCAPSHRCARGGHRTIGETCGSEADCASGLRCNPIGLAAECQPEGTKDSGAACALGAECFAGLLCSAKACAPFPDASGAPPVAVSTWKGVDCAPEPGPVSADFRVPRAAGDQDFFRLPYPNDARLVNGKLDLSGFPSPGDEVLGYDLVDRYRQYVEATSSGFSAYPTITMRFSAPIDYPTLQTAGALRMVDVTKGAGGADVGFTFSAIATRTKYVCENAITARMPPGSPLEPGHTYAFIVTNVVRAPGGAAIGVPADLQAVLGATDPGAPLSNAWSAYAALRTWAAGAAFDLGTIVNATVFSVARSHDAAQRIADAVLAAPAPTATGWIRCGSAPSSCPESSGERACGPADPTFDELHALVTLPVWQKGKPPFATPSDGGDADGTIQGTQQVCMSLTIPKGTMPAGGWPLAIHAPDIGGHFRSALVDGIAQRFASADGGAAKVAVLTIDPPLHGATKTASIAYPTQNPGAMRGRALQAEGDVLSLLRLAASLDLSDVASPTGTAIKLAPSPILVGHGEGATAVSIAAPHAAIGGVVLAGVPASFLDAVVVKRAPADFVDVAPVVLGETALTPAHPALALFENAFDAVDPLDHASSLVVRPVTTAKTTFVVYGQSDTFTPGVMQRAFTVAAGLGVASPPQTVSSPDDIGTPVLPVPAGGNYVGTTAIVRQYAPQSFDGHVVFVRDADAMRDVDRFVADIVNGKTPMVGR